GAYTVTLTVTDNRGGTATTTQSVTAVEPDNQLPTASFTTTVDQLAVSVDAGASSDPDGSVASYKWDFGDGSAVVEKTTATTTHTYTTAGDYTVTLTVTDNRGGTATATKSVTVGAQQSGVIIAESANWQYYYGSAAPDSSWKNRTFDDSGWSTGAAPIGYGSTLVTTDLNPTSVTADRPRAAYFRANFSVVDPSKVSALKLTTVADDGAVIYVNGTEVNRTRMDTGTITNASYATSALRTTAANASPVVIDVPTNLLVTGKNVISAETHVNYRGTPDISFKLKADITISSTSANQSPTASFSAPVSGLTVNVDGSGSSDPDGSIASYAWDFGDGSTKSGATASHTYAADGTYTVKLTVTDDKGATDSATKSVTVATPVTVTSEVIAESATWSYYYALAAPGSSWTSRTFNDSSWSTGKAPLGYGSTLVTTTFPVASATSDRPKAAYFRNSFTVADASKVTSLKLTTVADDGVVIFVNGTEVKRENMPTGTINNDSFAVTALRTTAANANPIQVDVPTSLLVNGNNVISAETHVNYRGTPDLSFKLKAVAAVAQ
ncbi:PKD domain-containing protein, partial [Propionicimonas sp.]|uniref:PKD domain-containing protein n=1 Tax=Propionicimonas sp. TaxID=1955623 RepID=UPI0039E452A5